MFLGHDMAWCTEHSLWWSTWGTNTPLLKMDMLTHTVATCTTPEGLNLDPHEEPVHIVPSLSTLWTWLSWSEAAGLLVWALLSQLPSFFFWSWRLSCFVILFSCSVRNLLPFFNFNPWALVSLSLGYAILPWVRRLWQSSLQTACLWSLSLSSCRSSSLS